MHISVQHFDILKEVYDSLMYQNHLIIAIIILCILIFLKKKQTRLMRRKAKNFFSKFGIIIALFFLANYKRSENHKLFLCILALIVFRWSFHFLYKFEKHHRLQSLYKKSGISDVDNMNGHAFEEFLFVQFKRLGYKCQLVGSKGHDYGVDLLIQKNGIITAVQAKRYKNRVGIKAIQEIQAGKSFYNAQQAMVVTNNYYTSAAINLAEKCNVTLWNRDDCISNFRI